MSRIDDVLRLYRQGWAPSRIARDLRTARDEVDAILERKSAWERLDAGDGSTGDQILAALRRHEGDFEFSEVEAEVELLLDLADRLDAKKGWSPERRRGVLCSLENVVNTIVSGFATSPLQCIRFRMALKSLGSLDESEWPEWLWREVAAA